MIGRRGFLGGLLALIAAPLAYVVAPKGASLPLMSKWDIPICTFCGKRIWAGDHVSIPGRLHMRCAQAYGLRGLVMEDPVTPGWKIYGHSRTTYPQLKGRA